MSSPEVSSHQPDVEQLALQLCTRHAAAEHWNSWTTKKGLHGTVHYCRPLQTVLLAHRLTKTTCWHNLVLPSKYSWQSWHVWTSTGLGQNLLLFGSKCSYAKEHDSTKRVELQAKWTQKGLKWWKELRSIRTAEKGITFVLEILISHCQSTAEAQQPACSSVA